MNYLSSLANFDYIVLTLLLSSLVVGLFRGIVKEVVIICSWVAAFIITTQYGQQFSQFIFLRYQHHDHASNTIAPFGLTLLCCAVLAISTLMAGNIIYMLIRPLYKISGLSFTNRLCGAILGAARGLLIPIILLLLLDYAGLANINNEYNNSQITKYLLPLALRVKQVVDPYMNDLKNNLNITKDSSLNITKDSSTLKNSPAMIVAKDLAPAAQNSSIAQNSSTLAESNKTKY